MIPVALFWRLRCYYFPFQEMKALDREIAMVEAVIYELSFGRRLGGPPRVLRSGSRNPGGGKG